MGHPGGSQFGPFLIDVGERTLRRDGEPVPLTPKAFDVLVALLEKPGQLISKDELLQTVWPGTFVEESNLAYNIFALRKALGDTAENSRYIETVPKKGYRFRASVSPAGRPGNAQPASELGAESGRTPFTGDTRDGKVTILPFRRGPAQSQVALERKAESYSDSAAVEPLAVPDSDPLRRFSFRGPWLWFAAAAVVVAAGFSAVQSRWNSPEAAPPLAVPLTSLPESFGLPRCHRMGPTSRSAGTVPRGTTRTYTSSRSASPPLRTV